MYNSITAGYILMLWTMKYMWFSREILEILIDKVNLFENRLWRHSSQRQQATFGELAVGSGHSGLHVCTAQARQRQRAWRQRHWRGILPLQRTADAVRDTEKFVVVFLKLWQFFECVCVAAAAIQKLFRQCLPTDRWTVMARSGSSLCVWFDKVVLHWLVTRYAVCINWNQIV